MVDDMRGGSRGLCVLANILKKVNTAPKLTTRMIRNAASEKSVMTRGYAAMRMNRNENVGLMSELM